MQWLSGRVFDLRVRGLWSEPHKRYCFVSLDKKLYSSCGILTIIEPCHWISNNVVCATSKASNQLAHTCSLIGALLVA